MNDTTTVDHGKRNDVRPTTDVGGLLSFGLAAPFYGLAILAARSAPPAAREILLERGWPPHATLMISSLAVAILLVKAVGLARQRRAFSLGLVGDEVGTCVEAARALERVQRAAAGKGGRSFLVQRLARVLGQFVTSGSVADASAANDAQSDADAAAVAGSFSTVKVLVWAMPILGLIGTVIGLSGAVGAFSHAMSGAEQLDTIKDSLRQVTTGLAVAFDATFVALVASIVVMLPMTWLQKGEDKLIHDVDDHCVTHVLARLGGEEKEETTAEETEDVDVRALVLEAVAEPLAEVAAAHAKALERIGEQRNALATELAAVAIAIQRTAPAIERAAEQLERATSALGQTSASVAPTLARAVAELDRTTAEVTRFAPSLERAADQLERTTSELGARVERATTGLESARVAAAEATAETSRAQDHLSRELGASRQLLSLLAASLGASDASHAKRGTNGVAHESQQPRGA